MKVFISWSGRQSKAVAEVLRGWLPGVLQAVRPYFTPDDIDKGSRWNEEISKELESSSVGLICLTRENMEAPWIMFEAGALSKNLEKSKVCTLLFGLEPTDIKGPLVPFQASRFHKEEWRKVVKTINAALGEKGLENEVLNSVFDKWWPDLEKRINEELSKKEEQDEHALRTERDILIELLELSRSLSRSVGSLEGSSVGIRPRYIELMRRRAKQKSLDFGDGPYTEQMLDLVAGKFIGLLPDGVTVSKFSVIPPNTIRFWLNRDMNTEESLQVFGVINQLGQEYGVNLEVVEDSKSTTESA